MDPFKSVLADAEKQLGSAQLLLRQYRAQPSPDKLVDLHNTIQEISEIIRELTQSIAAVQARPDQFGFSALEIESRIEQVGHINNQVNDIQEALAGIRQDSRRGNGLWNQGEQQRRDETERGAQEAPVLEEDRQMLFQSTMAEQDTILDEVEQTVASLRKQANVMSRELDDQAELIDDFEGRVDSSNDRIRRGMKRVDWVLRNNRDALSSCCIGFLIIVLIILLTLVIIT